MTLHAEEEKLDFELRIGSISHNSGCRVVRVLVQAITYPFIIRPFIHLFIFFGIVQSLSSCPNLPFFTPITPFPPTFPSTSFLYFFHLFVNKLRLFYSNFLPKFLSGMLLFLPQFSGYNFSYRFLVYNFSLRFSHYNYSLGFKVESWSSNVSAFRCIRVNGSSLRF